MLIKHITSSLLKSLVSFFESFGRARAATILAKQGRTEEAKRVLIQD